MRTTTLVLIVAGVVLLAVALWLTTVLPFRTYAVYLKDDEVEATLMKHLNLWGTLVRKSRIHLYSPVGGRTREVQEEGGAMGVNDHGRWTYRERYNDGEWAVSTRWYIDGKMVTEQEWNAYLRRR